MNLLPKPEELQSFTSEKLRLSQKQVFQQNLTCDQAIDRLYSNIVDPNQIMGSLFYLLVNGWYLGNWGDYGSCLADATDSQYILATVTGEYDRKNKKLFTRGSFGKYSNFTTRLGLCLPS